MKQTKKNRRNGTLSRRSWMKTSAFALGGTLVAPSVLRKRYPVFMHSDDEYSDRTIRLIHEALVIDMLSLFSLDEDEQRRWMTDPNTLTEDLERFFESGIDIFHPAVGIGGPNAYEYTLQFLGTWNGLIANQEALQRVDNPHHFRRAKDPETIGVVLGVQNSSHFRTVDDVDRFYGLGQRVSQLTYNAQNRIGSGSTDRVDGGLSHFGVAVVERMNEVGMAVDVSHSGDQTTLDACEVSEKPVLITHSNCRALVPGHPRTKTDEAIRKMAETGGVMGITGVRNFVRDREPTTIEHALDHFDHVVDLVGVDHVGVGSDIALSGYDSMPAEQLEELRSGYRDTYAFREKLDIDAIAHPKRMFDLTEGLIRRGYTDSEIEKILGGNFERALSEIWTVPEEDGEPRTG